MSLLALMLTALPLSTSAQGVRSFQRDPVRIMPLGNSITEGDSGSVTYRYFLWHLLRDAGFEVDFVGTGRGVRKGVPRYPDFDQDHQGIRDISAEKVVSKAAQWVRRTMPDVVLMDLGANELLAGDRETGTITALGRVVDSMRSAHPEITVLIARITAVSVDVTPFNRMMGVLADSLTTSRSRIIPVDLFSALRYPTDFRDGLHPNDSGDHRMAQAWFRALVPILKDSLRAVVFDPVENQRFDHGAAIPLRVRVTGSESVRVVEFHADSLLLGSDSIAPYELRWNGGGQGRHTVHAIARGRDRLIALSGPVRIEIAPRAGSEGTTQSSVPQPNGKIPAGP